MTTRRARGLATAADLRDDRQEVVRGEVVRKASPSFEHSDVQGAVYAMLFRFRGRGNGADRPGGWWLGTEAEIELETDEVYVPDVAGWRITRVPERPHGRPVHVTPDWICELLSPSTMGRDLGHKLRTYHRAKVSHYWVVEPIGEVLSIYRWQESGYLLALTAAPGDVVRAEPFEAMELDVAELFDRRRER